MKISEEFVDVLDSFLTTSDEGKTLLIKSCETKDIKNKDGILNKRLVLYFDDEGRKKSKILTIVELREMMDLLGDDTSGWLGKALKVRIVLVAGKEYPTLKVA